MSEPSANERQGKSVLETRHEKSPGIILILIAIIVVLSTRLPFLGAGYGNDTDAWLVAGAARSIADTGEYIASRLPGYPIQELVYSLFWWGGPIALNGLTALMSAAAILFFCLILREFGCRHILLAALALAFTPVFYINSTVSMDYIWALAFALGSFYFALKGRAVISGLLLGLAVGCRITSGAMLLPGVLLLAGPRLSKPAVKKILLFAGVTAAVALLSYLPPFLTYGAGFFSFYKVLRPGLFQVLKGASEDLWGAVGLLGILAAAVYQLILWARSGKWAPEPSCSPKRLGMAAIWLAVIIYALLYAALPYEPEYLLPAVPFVIILFASLLRRKAFVTICIALVISPFIVSFGKLSTEDFISTYQWHSDFKLSFSVGGQPYFADLAGPIISDFYRRQRAVRYLEWVIEQGGKMSGKSVVVAGRWIGPLAVLEYDDIDPNPRAFRKFLASLNDLGDIPSNFRLKKQKNTVYEHYLLKPEMERYAESGYKIYYSPDYREMNLLITRLDLREIGATPLPLPAD